MKKLQFLILILTSLFLAKAQADTLPDAENLNLASVNGAVADLESGKLLYAKNAHHVVPIASVTKLMSAMVVLDGGQPLNEWVTIIKREHEPPNNGYSRMRIGSELKRGDLLRLMLMSSENLAASVLARTYLGGEDAFVAAMNAKARALGMTQTHFVGPSGLSPYNRSTAADLVKMVRAATRYAKIHEYTTTGSYLAEFRNPHYTLGYGNTDALVRRGEWQVLVSKTGYLNEAGRCLVLATRIDGHNRIMVFLDSLGSLSPIGDAGRVRDWLTTGNSGRVAGAARRYERQRVAAYQQARADGNPR